MADDIIALSDDEPDLEPHIKKAKLTDSIEAPPVNNVEEKSSTNLECVIVLSDDEDELVMYENKTENNLRYYPAPSVEIEAKPEDNIMDSTLENIVDKDTPDQNKENVVNLENNAETSDQNIQLNGEPSSSTSYGMSLIEEFLNVCERQSADKQFDLRGKFPLVIKLFNKCGSERNSKSFKDNLERFTNQAKTNLVNAVFAFQELVSYLKTLAMPYVEVESAEHAVKLKKLEKTVRALDKKIKQLEQAEVDFDDEENSTYMQLDRYIGRLDKVYKKYCQLLKRNPYQGRIIHERISFVQSDYNEINSAINKKFKNSVVFPTYHEIETCIRKCVEVHNLPLNEQKILYESKTVFTKLGELLQTKRRRELFQTHYHHINSSEDPAKLDPQLETRLKSNSKVGKANLDKIHELYVQKQENGEDETINLDSDDSSAESDKSDS